MGFYVNDEHGFREIQQFDKAVQGLKDSYEYMQHRMEKMQQTLQEWNKDTEIQKYKEQAQSAYQHSLLQLSDKELEDLKAFREKHWRECAEQYHSKARGNTYIYELTGTGLGTCITVTCPICGQSEDITDIDSW